MISLAELEELLVLVEQQSPHMSLAQLEVVLRHLDSVSDEASLALHKAEQRFAEYERRLEVENDPLSILQALEAEQDETLDDYDDVDVHTLMEAHLRGENVYAIAEDELDQAGFALFSTSGDAGSGGVGGGNGSTDPQTTPRVNSGASPLIKLLTSATANMSGLEMFEQQLANISKTNFEEARYSMSDLGTLSEDSLQQALVTQTLDMRAAHTQQQQQQQQQKQLQQQQSQPAYSGASSGMAAGSSALDSQLQSMLGSPSSHSATAMGLEGDYQDQGLDDEGMLDDHREEEGEEEEEEEEAPPPVPRRTEKPVHLLGQSGSRSNSVELDGVGDEGEGEGEEVPPALPSREGKPSLQQGGEGAREETQGAPQEQEGQEANDDALVHQEQEVDEEGGNTQVTGEVELPAQLLVEQETPNELAQLMAEQEAAEAAAEAAKPLAMPSEAPEISLGQAIQQLNSDALEETVQAAMAMVYYIDNPQVLSAMGQNEAVMQILGMYMCSPVRELQVYGAMAFRKFADDADLLAMYCSDEEFLQAVVDSFDNEDSDLQMVTLSLSVLIDMVESDDSGAAVRHFVHHPEWVAVILRLLSHADTDVCTVAAYLVSLFALHDKCAKHVLHHNGIPTLLGMCVHGNANVQSCALRAVCNLANSDASQRAILAEAGNDPSILASMVAMLAADDVDAEVRMYAASVVTNLSTAEEGTALLLQAGALPVVTGMLALDDMPQLQLQAAWALSRLVPLSEDSLMEFRSLMGFDALVGVMVSPQEEIRSRALWSLSHIAKQKPESTQDVFLTGALEPILYILGTEGSSLFAVEQCLRLLSSMLTDDVIATQFAELHGVPVLVNMLMPDDVVDSATGAVGGGKAKSSDVDDDDDDDDDDDAGPQMSAQMVALRAISDIALGCLYSMARVSTESCLAALGASEALAFVADKLTRAHTEADIMPLVEFVTRVASLTDNMERIREQNVIPPLVALMGHEAQNVRQLVATSIRYCAVTKENSMIIREALLEQKRLQEEAAASAEADSQVEEQEPEQEPEQEQVQEQDTQEGMEEPEAGSASEDGGTTETSGVEGEQQSGEAEAEAADTVEQTGGEETQGEAKDTTQDVEGEREEDPAATAGGSSPAKKGKVKFKCHFKEDIRVVSAAQDVDLAELAQKVAMKYASSGFVLKYKDEDGDLVTLEEQEDLVDVMDECGGKKVNLYLFEQTAAVMTVSNTELGQGAGGSFKPTGQDKSAGKAKGGTASTPAATAAPPPPPPPPPKKPIVAPGGGSGGKSVVNPFAAGLANLKKTGNDGEGSAGTGTGNGKAKESPGDMMSEIRKGMSLKKIGREHLDADKRKTVQPSDPFLSTLLSAMASRRSAVGDEQTGGRGRGNTGGGVADDEWDDSDSD